MTHHLKRKAVWNSTHEQIKAGKKSHTQTLLRKKKQSKGEDYLKKGSTTHCTSYINFSGWPWCDAMRTSHVLLVSMTTCPGTSVI